MGARNTDQLNVKEFIHQIVYLIRHNNDYNCASEIMIKNNISIEELSENTLKFTDIEFARLADVLIEKKN